MGILEDAYEYGIYYYRSHSHGMGLQSAMDGLRNVQSLSIQAIPNFFKEYRDYPYTHSNSELVQQAIYLGLLNEGADRIQRVVKSEYGHLRGEYFASGMMGEFTGERQEHRRVVNLKGTPLDFLMDNFRISTGQSPDKEAIEQLKLIEQMGDRIARQHGATSKNINWLSINLYLHHGMTHILPEHISEIQEEIEELFREPSIKEELKDAKAVYNDYKYNIVLAWYGGSQITVFYNGKEENVITLGGVPNDAKIAEQAMYEITKEPDYPEFLANDEKTYKEFLKLSGHSA